MVVAVASRAEEARQAAVLLAEEAQAALAWAAVLQVAARAAEGAALQVAARATEGAALQVAARATEGAALQVATRAAETWAVRAAARVAAQAAEARAAALQVRLRSPLLGGKAATLIARDQATSSVKTRFGLPATRCF